MTPKQQIFADEYLKDLNGSRAYKVAYPHVKKDGVARANASRLLTNANIKQYIDGQLEKMHQERTATAQDVIEYLSRVMNRKETEDQVVVTKKPKVLTVDGEKTTYDKVVYEETADVIEIRTKVSDANKAAEL
ncbi:terminase small subunit, partial [Lactobacillus sp. CC-MHH1034]